jgi:hypothetical protein
MEEVHLWCISKCHEKISIYERCSKRILDPEFMDPNYRAPYETLKRSSRDIVCSRMHSEQMTFMDLWRDFVTSVETLPLKIRKTNERSTWITGARSWSEKLVIECSIRSDKYGSIGKWLGKFLEDVPVMRFDPSDCPKQLKEAEKKDLPFPGLAKSLQTLQSLSRGAKDQEQYRDDIFLILHMYSRIGMYAVDIFRYIYHGTEIDDAVRQ